jgi:hypothetical protein
VLLAFGDHCVEWGIWTKTGLILGEVENKSQKSFSAERKLATTEE